jgi:predicted RecA/RadA family phage recombinase
MTHLIAGHAHLLIALAILAGGAMFGMLNQVYPDGDVCFFLCPAAVTKGMPVLIGVTPAVAIDDYNPRSGGTVFALEGVYALSVVATAAIGPGGKIYAAAGTLDAPTNVTTGLTLSSVNTGVPFGALLGPGILIGVTNPTAPVRLNQSV